MSLIAVQQEDVIIHRKCRLKYLEEMEHQMIQDFKKTCTVLQPLYDFLMVLNFLEKNKSTT